jgi:glucose/arabinose dehydrogenase
MSILHCCALGALAVVAACTDEPSQPPVAPDTTLRVVPAGLDLIPRQILSLAAVLIVGDSDTVAVEAAWASRDTAVATSSNLGRVTGQAVGATWVVAEAYQRADSARITVTATPAVPPGLALVTQALVEPVFATAPPGDTTRLFVVEKGGTIRVLRRDSLLATPFLDLAGQVSTGGEQGLLSMAFHPAYATNKRVFVSYTDLAGDSRIVRYTASGPETLDPATATLVLTVDQPYSNHNGGLIAFGPDGMLYVGLGDGGSGGDPLGNGQSLTTLLGKILRLDVNGAAPYVIPAGNPFASVASARGEIWASGLRNPWRFSFDRGTGDLYIGDVGQGAREEVDVQPGASTGGENYGWNVMEGSTCYNAATCSQTGLTLPVAEYTHAEGCSITGGYVYRGSRVPSLTGRYLYGDYCQGWVRSFTLIGGQAKDGREWPDLAVGSSLTSFAEDARGELYVMTITGRLYRIVPN